MKKIMVACLLALVISFPATGLSGDSSSGSHSTSRSTKAKASRTNAAKAAKASKTQKPTAKCRDGTLSYSEHRSGTCSHHGGVAEWGPSD